MPQKVDFGRYLQTVALKSLSLKLSLHAIVILLQYPLEMFVVVLFSYRRLYKVYIIGLQSALDRKYVKKNLFFHFSVKDLITFVKNSKDTGATQVS